MAKEISDMVDRATINFGRHLPQKNADDLIGYLAEKTGYMFIGGIRRDKSFVAHPKGRPVWGTWSDKFTCMVFDLNIVGGHDEDKVPQIELMDSVIAGKKHYHGIRFGPLNHSSLKEYDPRTIAMWDNVRNYVAEYCDILPRPKGLP